MSRRLRARMAARHRPLVVLELDREPSQEILDEALRMSKVTGRFVAVVAPGVRVVQAR